MINRNDKRHHNVAKQQDDDIGRKVVGALGNIDFLANAAFVDWLNEAFEQLPSTTCWTSAA